MGKVVDVCATQKLTSAGSSETAEKALADIPTGPFSPLAVITVTPEAKLPRDRRKEVASMEEGVLLTLSR